MTIHLEVYQLVMILFAIVAGFWALFYALAKVIGKQLDSKFQAITDHLGQQDARLTSLEKEFSNLRAELYRDYVHHNDYTRDIGTLSSKFEVLAINVERMLHAMTKDTLQMIKDAMKEARK